MLTKLLKFWSIDIFYYFCIWVIQFGAWEDKALSSLGLELKGQICLYPLVVPLKIIPEFKPWFNWTTLGINSKYLTNILFCFGFFFSKDRIAKGEKNVMTHQEPWMLADTSGTTGKSCLIPKTRDNSRAFVKFGFAVGVYHTIFGALPQVRR